MEDIMRELFFRIASASILVLSTASLTHAAGLNVLSIYANSGNANTKQLNGGANNVTDQIEIDCPKPQCTLILNAMADVEDGDPTKEWFISAMIDKQAPDPKKTGYQGVFLKSGYVTGNWQAIYQVQGGTHSVEFFTYGGSEYFLNAWSNTIVVAAP
jgi:hypothetical protein